MIAHLLFEQSGTFKKEFKKLGIDAYDYDILNDFNETDYQIDLFKEIEVAYERERETVFDKMTSDDIVFAFFPCVRFEVQIKMQFRGDAFQCRKRSDIKKLKHAIKLHNELNHMYQLISKLCCVCIERNLKLIIENPYGQNYLESFFPLKSKLIDLDRSINGDYFKKPTQYRFINCDPKNNLLFEPRIIRRNLKDVAKTTSKVERSMISGEYANRFIRQYIL